MKKIIFFYFLFTLNASAETMYFKAQEGHQTLLYKANCNEERCSLGAISITSAGQPMNCRLDVYSFFEDVRVVRSGEAWIVSDSSGPCGYTNTYVISKNGMTHTKTYPQKKKLSFCLLDAPQVYKMEPITNAIGMSVSGCKEIYPLGF
jgi:hypothetical protein